MYIMDLSKSIKHTGTVLMVMSLYLIPIHIYSANTYYCETMLDIHKHMTAKIKGMKDVHTCKD